MAIFFPQSLKSNILEYISVKNLSKIHTLTPHTSNRTLGFLKRNLRINSSTVKEKAYKSLVRPKLEYCNTVWDPKCITNPKDGDKTSHRLVDQLEMVQRRAARWVTGRYHNTSSVSDILRSLGWRSLEQRRVDFRLPMLFKIRHHLVAIDEESCLKRGTGRREHQYRQLRADKDYTRFSFFPRTVIQWNQLPSHICLAESLDTFKTQIAKIEHSRLNLFKEYLLSLCLSPSFLPSVFLNSVYSNSSFSFSYIFSLALHW